jgi:hypothetical protein
MGVSERFACWVTGQNRGTQRHCPRAHGVLCETAWARDGQITVSAPQLWQLGDVLGDRRVVNFTDPEGVGFQLIEQAPFPNATLDSYGLGGVDRSHLQG